MVVHLRKLLLVPLMHHNLQPMWSSYSDEWNHFLAPCPAKPYNIHQSERMTFNIHKGCNAYKKVWAWCKQAHKTKEFTIPAHAWAVFLWVRSGFRGCAEFSSIYIIWSHLYDLDWFGGYLHDLGNLHNMEAPTPTWKSHKFLSSSPSLDPWSSITSPDGKLPQQWRGKEWNTCGHSSAEAGPPCGPKGTEGSKLNNGHEVPLKSLKKGRISEKNNVLSSNKTFHFDPQFQGEPWQPLWQSVTSLQLDHCFGAAKLNTVSKPWPQQIPIPLSWSSIGLSLRMSMPVPERTTAAVWTKILTCYA